MEELQTVGNTEGLTLIIEECTKESLSIIYWILARGQNNVLLMGHGFWSASRQSESSVV